MDSRSPIVPALIMSFTSICGGRLTATWYAMIFTRCTLSARSLSLGVVFNAAFPFILAFIVLYPVWVFLSCEFRIEVPVEYLLPEELHPALDVVGGEIPYRVRYLLEAQARGRVRVELHHGLLPQHRPQDVLVVQHATEVIDRYVEEPLGHEAQLPVDLHGLLPRPGRVHEELELPLPVPFAKHLHESVGVGYRGRLRRDDHHYLVRRHVEEKDVVRYPGARVDYEDVDAGPDRFEVRP